MVDRNAIGRSLRGARSPVLDRAPTPPRHPARMANLPPVMPDSQDPGPIRAMAHAFLRPGPAKDRHSARMLGAPGCPDVRGGGDADRSGRMGPGPGRRRCEAGRWGQSGGVGVLRGADPADPGREVRELPRAEEAIVEPEAGQPGGDAQGGRLGPGDRARAAGGEPGRPGGRASSRRAEDAAEGEAARRGGGHADAVGRHGRPVAGRMPGSRLGGAGDSAAEHWAFRPVRPASPPRGQGSVVGPVAGRRVRPGPAGGQGDRPVAAGRPPHAHPPRHHRPLGHPADARGGRGVRGRHRAGCLRPADRPPAGLAAIRRALGPPLARRRPIRRHQGLRLHPGAAVSLLLHLPRLRHRRLQRRPAV